MSVEFRRSLLSRIKSFRYWHYPFDLGQGLVITPTHGSAEAAQEMRDLIWPEILRLCGGGLEGVRVLDVGCNAGFWSLEACKSGAAYVLGIDAAAEAIAQAELVREALDIEAGRLEYRQLNVYDVSPGSVGEYDLCLLFRVLHHLSNPLLALEKMRQVCRASLVIDVALTQHKESVLALQPYDPTEPFCGVGNGLALKPSRTAVEPMLNHSGFSSVRLIPPKPPLTNREYYRGTRAFFTARVSI